ncbi:hypothetical protein [Streptomyces sp. NPDC086519]|uniref:hypothetical protein n=1 Tax=Streptomyces sp. NPDC086519 TaxID=3154863 RepID=UPI00341C4DBA
MADPQVAVVVRAARPAGYRAATARVPGPSQAMRPEHHRGFRRTPGTSPGSSRPETGVLESVAVFRRA